jgi:hypothetical protein|tara:strand:- start:1430 stop:1696 length:267 start_codon:yes stop_codon:yes gene_type:complete
MLNQTEIKSALHEGVCSVTFTKVNGDERVMNATLKADLLPAVEPVAEGVETKTKKVNPDVIAVYDVKAPGWRSFRWDSVKAFAANVES